MFEGVWVLWGRSRRGDRDHRTYLITPGRMGGQKPGFFTKRRVATRRFDKKPGFFGLDA